MPETVRVGDTVTYHIGGGEYTTAEITAVTSQDDIDIRYPHHGTTMFTAQANVARATTWPPAADTFFKKA